MEVSGIVFRQASCFSSNSTSNSHNLHSFSQSRSFCLKQQSSRKSLIALAGCDEFSDKSHLQYYDNNSGSRISIKEKEMKKQLKLVKGLSKNLAIFSDMGFGLNLDNGLDQQVRGKMISEATEVLVEQLKKLKAEKMELKRRKKEEKAKKKAAKMMDCKCKDSSSSSSSESECEKLASSNVSQLLASSNVIAHGETTSSLMLVDEVEKIERNEKLEVCMGGKCKKSGAAVLLENFQRAVGSDEMVVGCKCMGKCRDGPNVKVVSNNKSNINGNPLCMMGVGLEDVDSIVNNYLFGGNMMGNPSPAPAPAPAL